MDQKAIDKLTPGSKRAYHWDPETPGLCYIVQPTGSTSWRYQREERANGRRIGTHYWTLPGTAKLKEARAWAVRHLAAPFPQGDEQPTAWTVHTALTTRLDWMKAKGKASVADFEFSIKYLAMLHDIALNKLTKKQCRDCHAYNTKNGLTGRPAPYPANKAMDHLTAAWNYARGFDEAGDVPVECPAKFVERNPEYPREGRLTIDKLPAWASKVAALPNPTRQAFNWLALLTGLRGGTLKQIEVAWCSEDRITIPAHVIKSRRSFVVPLSTPAREWIQKATATSNCSKWLFPSDTSASGHLEEWKEPTMPGWTTHETRKAYRTQLELIAPTTIARSLMDHKTPGIERNYVTTRDLFAARLEAQEAVAQKILLLTVDG